MSVNPIFFKAASDPAAVDQKLRMIDQGWKTCDRLYCRFCCRTAFHLFKSVDRTRDRAHKGPQAHVHSTGLLKYEYHGCTSCGSSWIVEPISVEELREAYVQTRRASHEDNRASH